MNQSDNLNEMLPVVDENGNIIDAATRGECHGGSRKLHPVVHLHVFNSKGELYLQKRPDWKDIQPGKWDTAVGGHVDFGENVERALVREVREELGIELLGMKDKLDEAKDGYAFQLMHYVFDSVRERELVFVNTTVYDEPITPSDETDGGRFWSEREINEAMGKNVLTPNFEMEYRKLMEAIGRIKSGVE